MGTDQQPSRWTPERVAIGLGVAASMAGNVAWAAPRSPVLVGVGVAMSLVLPVAVRLWRATPTPSSKWGRFERAAVMALVCAGAAAYSLVHATLLLADPEQAAAQAGDGLPWGIAWVPAVVIELLVVMAARASQPAHHDPAGQSSGTSSAGTAGTRKRDRRRDTRPARPPAPATAASPARSPERPPVPSTPPSPERPRTASPAVPPPGTGSSPAAVPSRPMLVPPPVSPPPTSGDADPGDMSELDEPPVPGESPEDKRRRLDRNKKRRQRARRAAEQQDDTDGEATG